MKKWIVSTENDPWRESVAFAECKGEELLIGEPIGKPIYGFGCCISEICVQAIRSLPEKLQNEIFDELFGKDGCAFSFCRLPIGANDFAASWYSYNEHEGDYGMEHFSIERDRKYIIPAIKDAKKRSEDLRFFASPWSPPTWMKYPAVYNYGRIVESEENLRAYALYLKKYVQEYKKEQIDIEQIHVQNEIHANQKFPSCVWSGEALARFIVGYLKPELGDEAEIWFGTVNGPEKDIETRHRNYLGRALQLEGFAEAISGASYQWAGKFGITQAQEDFPELDTINSEIECGDGENTWEYAMYTLEMMHHYFKFGARASVYWNMALPKDSISTWGWKQNSLIRVEGDTYRFTPDFYAVKHFAHFVREGAVMLGTKGKMSSNATLFENPDGSRVAIIMNPFDFPKTLTVEGTSYTLEPRSFNTVLL